MASTPEGRVKDAIKKFLNTLPNCWWFLPGANGYGQHGIPDFVICYRGVFIGIEAKAPGKVETGVTPLQKMQLRAINMSMGYAIAVDNVETVKALFRDIDVTINHTNHIRHEAVEVRQVMRG